MFACASYKLIHLNRKEEEVSGNVLLFCDMIEYIKYMELSSCRNVIVNPTCPYKDMTYSNCLNNITTNILYNTNLRQFRYEVASFASEQSLTYIMAETGQFMIVSVLY